MANSSNVTPRSLRWGVNLLPDQPAAQVAHLGALAEELGFDRCWVFDEGLATRDLYVTLTALALSTHQIQLGPGITNPYTRHPGATAAAIASLDEFSGGRAFLGLGAGGSLTLDPLGITRHRPGTILRESVEAIRALLSGEPVTYEGTAVRLQDARLSYGDPDIPIWVAGRGPQILATGARLADGVSLDHIHHDFLGGHVEHVRSAAAEVGNEIAIAYSATIVVTDTDLERVRRHMTFRLVDSPSEVRAAIGLSDSDALAIRDAMGAGLDVAARLVPDEWIFPFVIHGSPAECAAQIVEAAHTHGFSEFTVPIPDLSVADETIATAADVADRVRESWESIISPSCE